MTEADISRVISEPNVEKDKGLNISIISLYRCESIDDMAKTLETAQLQGPVDTVLLGEYIFNIENTLPALEKIKDIAKRLQVDIIMAPDNRYGREFTWGELKNKLLDLKVETEQGGLSESLKPQSVGIFISKTGYTYAFPKMMDDEILVPAFTVHRIPHSTVGVTICGEIWNVNPKDLDGLTILYNPSKEGDDWWLTYRMLYRYDESPLTKERIEAMQPQFKPVIYDPNEPGYDPESDSVEAQILRKNKHLTTILKAAADPKDSPYVKNIREALRQRNIPAIRTDGLPGGTGSGVLNGLPDVKINGLVYEKDYIKYHLFLPNRSH